MAGEANPRGVLLLLRRELRAFVDDAVACAQQRMPMTDTRVPSGRHHPHLATEPQVRRKLSCLQTRCSWHHTKFSFITAPE